MEWEACPRIDGSSVEDFQKVVWDSQGNCGKDGKRRPYDLAYTS